MPGETGELVHRGILVAQGYWGDQELTKERYRKNPMQSGKVPIQETVVYSGDYVRMDSEGYLYFEGRKDEMIKCAGNRISPTEVEEILYNHESVEAAVAFGIPHETYGQSVLAIVSTKKGADVDAKELKKYCRESMPPYMVPTDIEIRQNLPCNENGKLDRSVIKKEVFAKRNIKKKI